MESEQTWRRTRCFPADGQPIENGRYDPSLPLAFKLAALFEMPIEELCMPDHPVANRTVPS